MRLELLGRWWYDHRDVPYSVEDFSSEQSDLNSDECWLWLTFCLLSWFDKDQLALIWTTAKCLNNAATIVLMRKHVSMLACFITRKFCVPSRVLLSKIFEEMPPRHWGLRGTDKRLTHSIHSVLGPGPGIENNNEK